MKLLRNILVLEDLLISFSVFRTYLYIFRPPTQFQLNRICVCKVLVINRLKAKALLIPKKYSKQQSVIRSMNYGLQGFGVRNFGTFRVQFLTDYRLIQFRKIGSD